VDGFQGGGFDPNNLVGVGSDLGQTILGNVPEQFRPVVEPLIPNIVSGIYAAISLAIANVFWLGVAGGAAAFVAVLFIRELPLRTATRIPVRTKDGAAAEASGAPSAGETAGAPSGAPVAPSPAAAHEAPAEPA
jgi:hypothetical protein